ncbi:MAG: endonuclease/exonuclease/phosphatase family protein [Sphaerochaeta sp.]
MKFRFSLMTLNLWNTIKLDERRPVIEEFFRIHRPDILCIQEIREDTIKILDDLLEDYTRVHDDCPSWSNESNIYYKRELFEEVKHDRVDLNMPEKERGLFYIVLKSSHSNKTLFISTAHLTHQGNADECRTGMNYRHSEAIVISESLKTLVSKNQPALICGDFNDPFHPYRIIKEKLGWIEVFQYLKLEAPITFPCTQNSDEIFIVESIDKIITNDELIPLMASSPRITGHVGLSDHYPVEAMFEIR